MIITIVCTTCNCTLATRQKDFFTPEEIEETLLTIQCEPEHIVAIDA